LARFVFGSPKTDQVGLSFTKKWVGHTTSWRVENPNPTRPFAGGPSPL